MALMKSLDSGISGLRAFQTKMDVIGNNIANVETTGFKSSDVTFSDMLSQTISSGGGSEDSPNSSAQVGLGVRIAAINRDFSQGGLQSTGRATDLSIEGDGFFMVNNGGQNYLTRAGNFSFNKDGQLVDQKGNKVQGFNANDSGQVLASGTTEDIVLDFNNVSEPKATQEVFVAGNLNSETSKTQVAQSQLAFTTDSGAVAAGNTALNDLAQTSSDFGAGDSIAFDVTLNDGTAQTITHNYAAGDTLDDVVATINSQLGAAEGTVSLVDGIMKLRSANPGESELTINGATTSGGGQINIPSFQVAQEGTTASKNISSTVYDGLGQAHTMIMKLTQTATNTWNYEASFLDGEEITDGATGTISFDASGNMTGGDTLNLGFEPGGGAETQNFSVKLGNPASGSKLTQFSGSSSVQVTSQDGYAQGELVDFNIDGGGNINGLYSNGRTTKLAQIAIGDVANYNGLESMGDNMFRKTDVSGDIRMNTASNMADTSMNSGVLEGSNVELAREFTNMITSQRAYQSNARVITTADELLQEVVNLKR